MAWNIGEGNAVISPALNGTLDKTPPTGARVGGECRVAPLGVPVVPLVRMMIAERLVALGAGAVLLRAISSARVSSVLPDGSVLSGLDPSARNLPSAVSANATASVNSSS